MKQSKQIKINKTIIAEETCLGKNAVLILEYATLPIIKLLVRKYHQDSTCISGDIDDLLLLYKEQVDIMDCTK